ncbi:MAG: GDP-mannose 4,6-dehydratase [Clostridiales bacterium]|nr:GDP-mannose 4,6-dehydratase [Clostridiales bacterium]
MDRKTILVTGSPGFVGANLVLRLLKEVKNAHIISLDSMNDYYDPKLKEYRLSEIGKAAHCSGSEHSFIRADLADKAALDDVFARLRPRRAEPFRPLV